MKKETKWELSEKRIKDDIKREAKVIRIPAGTAKIIADNVAGKILTWAKKRTIITENDLNERIAKEIRKYNEDLAYLFETKDKVI